MRQPILIGFQLHALLHPWTWPTWSEEQVTRSEELNLVSLSRLDQHFVADVFMELVACSVARRSQRLIKSTTGRGHMSIFRNRSLKRSGFCGSGDLPYAYPASIYEKVTCFALLSPSYAATTPSTLASSAERGLHKWPRPAFRGSCFRGIGRFF